MKRRDNTSILGLLGLANRARLTRGGAEAVKESIRKGKARLVILATDASDGTKKWVTRLTDQHSVPLIEQHTSFELGVSQDKAPKAVISIMNRHFADGIIKKTSIQAPMDTNVQIRGRR